jgi:hypothetical protein
MTARLNRVAERINIEAQRMNPDQSVDAVSGLALWLRVCPELQRSSHDIRSRNAAKTGALHAVQHQHRRGTSA